MARTHARLNTSIWKNEDFLNMTVATQRAYLLLLSQPDLSMCGVMAYTPGRWSLLASDSSRPSVEGCVKELARRRFVVVDRSTEELFIRTFVFHDGVLRGIPNLVKAMWNDFDAVKSQVIRDAFISGFPEPFGEGFHQSLRDGYEQRFGNHKANGRASPAPDSSLKAFLSPDSTTTPDSARDPRAVDGLVSARAACAAAVPPRRAKR